MTKEELENRMAVLLGGRAAEYIFFHHLSTGAADDLVKATDTARSMVLRYGMDKDLGHVAYERERPPMLGMPAQPNPYAREFSDETERLMDHAIRGLVDQAFDRAIQILNAHGSVHQRTAELLLQKETLEEDDIAALRAQIVPPEANTQPADMPNPSVAAGVSQSIALERGQAGDGRREVGPR
jgi:cell division protease FtsH